MKKLKMSLGTFRTDVKELTALYFEADNPLEPLYVYMPVDRISVILSASPYIALRSGSTSIALSHIRWIERSIKGGRKSYEIICANYTQNLSDPELVKYRLFCGDETIKLPF